MKSILMSIKPKWVAEILNGNKTLEIRKKFPKDYVGWVYIYCTKEKPYLFKDYDFDLTGEHCFIASDEPYPDDEQYLSGKVVARFWCDKVSEYINGVSVDNLNNGEKYSYFDYINDKVLEKSCLTDNELRNYCEDLAFSAIHITKLEIFDKPKEISEFKHIVIKQNYANNGSKTYKEYFSKPLSRAPQSWCWVEVLL